MSNRWQCLNCGYVHRGPAPPARCPICGAPFTAFQRHEKDPRARLRSVRILAERPPGYRYVIIGNSAAGRSAARAIQALDRDGKITVVSEESSRFYLRPLLPDFIGGMSRDDFLAMGQTFDDEGLEIIRDERAERLDPAAKQIVCASGRVVPYDALLLATGSTPIQIPWPGSDAEGIAYFRTFADAEGIAARVRSAAHAVVVGGGLLGLEFVRAFHAAGLRITQLVREPRVGAPALDEQAGTVLGLALADLGVTVATEEEVESFEACNGRVCGVRTSKGRVIECDLVGIAVGVRPRVELAQEAGAEVDRGVLVSPRFETSLPDVYAAGDVAQAYDRVWGTRRVNTSWRNSLEQGEAAGIAMAGGGVEYPGAVSANYQLAAGLPFCALGIANPPDPQGFEIEISADEQARTYRKLVKRDGRVVGAALIGDLSEAGAIEEQLRAAGPEESAAAEQGGRARIPAVTASTREQQMAGEATVPVPELETEGEHGMHKMTQQFVSESFAGESQAHIKYLNFAQKAEEEGKQNVARLFRAAAFSEQTHASNHLKVMGGVGSTSENLAAAMAGEGFEIAEMYPAYIAVASEQDEPEAQVSMEHALEAEKVHHGLYTRAKQAVDAGGDLAIGDLWVCSECGNTMEGEPPKRCPLCKAPQKFFVKF